MELIYNKPIHNIDTLIINSCVSETYFLIKECILYQLFFLIEIAYI